MLILLLVTGSESFVGRELISELLKQNKDVLGFDLLEKKSQNYEYKKIDIRVKNILEHIPENIDTIIHLAALSSDPLCKGKSFDAFDVNVMGTLNLLNAGKKKGIKQFIFASTEWVYEGFKNDEEKNEDTTIDIHQHKSEYALSKLVSEVNLKQEYKEDIDITILRFGIIYGPRKNNWSAVESIAHNVKESQEVTIGSKKTGRRFVHVDDIIQGIILGIGVQGFNIINLTGNQIVTLEEIIHTSEEVFNKKVVIKEKDSENISLRNPSNSKAKKILNWEPKIYLKEGIESIKKFI